MTSCSGSAEGLAGVGEREDNVFLTETYVLPWLARLAVGELEVVTLGGGSTLPLLLSTERVLGKKMRIWKSVGWNSAWYPYSFVPPRPESVSTFLDYLQSRSDRWDGVLVSCPSDLEERMEAGARERGWSPTLSTAKVLPFVTVQGSWDDYWKSLAKRLRVDVTGYLKRAEKQGTVELRKVSDREECERILERFVSLHDARWSARGQRSKYVTRERHRRFLEDVVRRAQEDERLYFPYLTLDSEPIAVAVCFLDRGKIYYVWPTFHVDFANLAPGKLLLYHILRDAFASGFREVDLGPGADAYKFLWTRQKREVSQVLFHQSSLRLWTNYDLLPRVRRAVRGALGGPLAARISGALDRAGLGGR
jgi:hypothetical protein